MDDAYPEMDPIFAAASERLQQDMKDYLSRDFLFVANPTYAPYREALRKVFEQIRRPLVLTSIIIPDEKTTEGLLVKSASLVWTDIVRTLIRNWKEAFIIPPDKWEEIFAGAFKVAKFDQVILTPRSGDHGRDVIAVKNGVGCIKIIGSMKANQAGNLASYDDVRSLLGVMAGERDTSKGIVTTTSDFPPNILKDPFIAPFVPTRLELMNGQALQRWLGNLLLGKDE